MKSWIVRAVENLEWVGGAFFMALFLLNLLRILSRYFLGVAWLWEPDFSRLLFVWIVFIGATVLYVRNGHLVVDYFLAHMRPNTRERMQFVIDLVTTVFLGVLVLKGVEVTKVRMRIPFDTWDIPTGYAYAAVPICSAVMIIISLIRMRDFIWNRRKK